MIDAAGPKKFGGFVLAPDHFRPRRDHSKAHTKSPSLNKAETGQMARPWPNPTSEPKSALFLREPAVTVIPPHHPAIVAVPAKHPKLQGGMRSPTIQPAAEFASICALPGPNVEPIVNVRHRLDLSWAREHASVLTRHAKRALDICRSGMGRGASWSLHAAKWSGEQARQAVSRLNGLMNSVAPPHVDPLKELASAARYTAISSRFASLAELSERVELAVRWGTPDRRIHQAGCDIILERETVPIPMFVASGWACRIRVSRGGHRQIVGFLLPGDGIALSTGPGSLANTTITALTSVETVSAEDVIAMALNTADYPGVMSALQRSSALDDEFLVNQIMRLGVSTVVERIAHLLLELHWRLRQAGLASSTHFLLPISEDTMADALGVKQRAVKSVLCQLQRHGIIKRHYGSIHITREDRLRDICGFRVPETSVHLGARRLICDRIAPTTVERHQNRKQVSCASQVRAS